MKSAIKIGASKKAIEAARDAILDILSSSNDQQTKQLALEVFRTVCAVSGVTVQDCTITMGSKKDD